MTIVSDTLPKTSEPLPLISFLIMFALIIRSLITLITLFNLRLFHKKCDATVPDWTVRVYRTLACQRSKTFAKNKVQTDETFKNNDKSQATGLAQPLSMAMHENGPNERTVSKQNAQGNIGPPVYNDVTW